MTLTVREEGEITDPVGEWPMAARPLFVPSAAYQTLRRDLLRYVSEAVPGRSYLIAGHRGSGKTALVTRAIEDLRTEILRDSVKEKSEMPAGPAFTMQRPLLVKVHGPSLLAATLPGPAQVKPPAAAPAPPPGQPGDPPAPQNQGKQGGGGAGGGAEHGEPATGSAAEPPPTQAHVALVQITLALYRALSTEVAIGCGAHARECHRDLQGSGDDRELAAQMLLNLDAGPEPAALRRFWAYLQRLPGPHAVASGLLWPRQSDPTLAARRLSDQAYREIVALSTAAQAYRICAGTEKESLDGSGSLSRETKIDSSGNLSTILNRSGAVVAGSLAGGAAAIGQQDAGTAVGIGIAIWLLSSFVLSWSTTRKRTDSLSRSYTFIRERGASTLERDLPVVIRRIRDAGLAPVFVLDELDKLDKLEDAGGSGVSRKTIESIIKTLKHLITDHGFFCFLTDRDYFDDIERALRHEVYPTEHTYFSERLLVRYRPADLLAYLLKVIETDKPGEERENYARTVLALKMIQRSKLNFADVARELTRLASGGQRLALTADQVFARLDYRLAAAMQLAIDHILTTPLFEKRLEDEPGLSQLAVDALYYVSRAWEEGKPDVDVSPAALRAHLQGRMRQSPQQTSSIDQIELDFMKRQVDKLCGLLCDWDRLREAVQLRADVRGCRAEDIPPEDSSGLLTKNGTDRWRFLYDSDGEETAARAQPEVPELTAVAKAFASLLDRVGLQFDDLVGAGLVPGHFSWPVLKTGISRLESDRGGYDRAEFTRRLEELRSVLDRRGRTIGAAIMLVDLMRCSSRLPEADAPDVLKRLGRLVDFKNFGSALRKLSLGSGLTRGEPLTGDAAAIRRWADALVQDRDEKPAAAPIAADDAGMVERSWAEWLDRVEGHLRGAEPPSGPLAFPNLLLAAADRPPATWFRADLDRMTAAEWTLVVLGSMQGLSASPPWAMIAGLRALGFGLAGLSAARKWIEAKSPAAASADAGAILDRMIEGAEARPGGTLIVASSTNGALRWLPAARPMLIVAESTYVTYIAELDTLSDLLALETFIDEQG